MAMCVFVTMGPGTKSVVMGIQWLMIIWPVSYVQTLDTHLMVRYVTLHVLIHVLQCVGAKSSSNLWRDYKYPYQFFNVKCYGNETSFFGCQYDTTGYCYYNNNNYYYAVAVFCHESKCNCIQKLVYINSLYKLSNLLARLYKHKFRLVSKL